jgi:hypothetical protein
MLASFLFIGGEPLERGSAPGGELPQEMHQPDAPGRRPDRQFIFADPFMMTFQRLEKGADALARLLTIESRPRIGNAATTKNQR